MLGRWNPSFFNFDEFTNPSLVSPSHAYPTPPRRYIPHCTPHHTLFTWGICEHQHPKNVPVNDAGVCKQLFSGGYCSASTKTENSTTTDANTAKDQEAASSRNPTPSLTRHTSHLTRDDSDASTSRVPQATTSQHYDACAWHPRTHPRRRTQALAAPAPQPPRYHPEHRWVASDSPASPATTSSAQGQAPGTLAAPRPPTQCRHRDPWGPQEHRPVQPHQGRTWRPLGGPPSSGPEPPCAGSPRV